jgi:hypothetical protein
MVKVFTVSPPFLSMGYFLEEEPIGLSGGKNNREQLQLFDFACQWLCRTGSEWAW